MEEPFPKRPRLSIFADQSTDAKLDEDLGALRYRNDHLLKSRFESIFEKYSHDFTGVGDEIDIVKGKVVVNNGHLEGMEDEADVGEIHDEELDGKSFLKAIAMESDGEDQASTEEADDLITSIEGIAEDTAMSDDETSSEDGQDESFTTPERSQSPYFTPPDLHKPPHTKDAVQEHFPGAKADAYDSDKDSLFEVCDQQRSSSPDSLFEVASPALARDDPVRHSSRTSPVRDEPEESAILQKYGPQIGKEVLEMLRKARNTAIEAQVEPAWRLPPDLVTPKPSKPTRSASGSKTPSNMKYQTPDHGEPLSSGFGVSVWGSNARQLSPQMTSRWQQHKRIREESVDPLQEEPSGDRSEQVQEGDELKVEVDEEEVVIWKSNRSNGRGNDEQVAKMRQGICFYCERQWKTRFSVFKHWEALVLAAEHSGTPPDGVHDMVYLRDYWVTAPKTPRGPRLGVENLKRLVEMHEGAGESFDEIAKSGALRTKKNGTELKEAYVRYRKRRSKKGKEDAREWTEAELETLDQLCRNPKADVATFARSFQNCSVTDVVDKLADIWLAALQNSGGEATEHSQSPRGPRTSRKRTAGVAPSDRSGD
ncbi:hypothetical protein A1O1_04100 [Capronia coronata CBS 617.96]|uniref:Myb-like domain-containing protein n=1 Tax=Capronia coronata CBS 617.96 TaxID=1182541 RepID=W9YEN7_9EURO|nr:uncharacterized protein A1O1_04100 [Capronia coronata CBS 617.96]EXJ90993.1 hypothetical protein A1O1_04100 [Capronia coronata CBS 617.96]